MARSILIIEHNQREADGLTRYLNENGYVVDVRTRGDEGVRAFKEHLHDLIFIDLVMPDMPGIEICKRIKTYEDGIRTPVYFLSPLASGHDLARRSNGASGTLTKPVNLGDMLAIVEKHLGPGDEAAVRQSQEQKERARRPGPSTPPPTPEPSLGAAQKVASRETPAPGAAEPKPTETGRVEKTGMPSLLARMVRERYSGRLELLTTERHCAIRFRDGVVVGLTSGDFLPYLIRTGRLNEQDAEKLRELRRRRRSDILDILRSEKTLGSVDVDLLVDRWRAEALREAALTTTGEYRLFPGEVEGTIHMDPLILIHHHLKTKGTGGAATVEPPRPDDPIRPVEGMDRRAVLPDPDLALILHAAESGATPAQIRGILPDSKAADTGIMALWLTGLIRQDAPDARSPQPAQPVQPPEPAVLDFEFEPEPTASSADEPTPSDISFSGDPFEDDGFAADFDDFDASLSDPVSDPTPIPVEPSPPSDTDYARLLDMGPDEDFADEVDADFEGLADTYAQRPVSSTRRRPAAQPRVAPSAASADFDSTFDAADPELFPGENSPAAPMSTREILRRADLLMKSKTYSRAQEYYEEAVLRQADDYEAWTKLARATYRNRFEERLARTVEAVRACRKAMALKPDFLPAYVTLDKIFDEETKFDLARGVVLQALVFHPQDEELHKRLRNLERRIQRRSG